MRAVVIEQCGGPEVLQHRDDLAVPTPGPGDVLVQVASAGINFMDVHTRQGKYKNSRTYPVRLPCTLGMEGAGRVAALGSDVEQFVVGERRPIAREEAIGLTVVTDDRLDPQGHARFLVAEKERWGEVIKDAGQYAD